ncbi:unnamed protein product [Caenorhabditis angaria]|uniref:aECM cysteine-cradle domain-containing protein n=1 Tax=Caenorhabditis angaria TaxID=860376 RepID=A0A9P1N5J2_9PELO|nr:unnamed protein product [Caenorhabditis angaria]
MTKFLLFFIIFIPLIFANSSILQRYEQRLNSALSKTGKTVKRYKCVEEYVTYDKFGKTVEAKRGAQFTSTVMPEIQREIRRKPARKVTIAMNDAAVSTTSTSTTTSIPIPSTISSSPTKHSFDSLNEEETDKLIEEMYLKKKGSHENPTTTSIPIATTTETVLPTKAQIYSTDMNSVDSILPPVSAPRYNPNPRKTSEEFIPFYPRRRSHRQEYDDDDLDNLDYEDFEYFQPFRRGFRRHEHRNSNVKVTRDLSPLKAHRRLRHQVPYRRYLPKAPPSGPPVYNKPVALPVEPKAAVEPVKMKPIEQSNPQEMQTANEESCSKIAKLAKNFGIKDVSSWSRSNCAFLQMYAPTASCDLIYHFIDSCKLQKMF